MNLREYLVSSCCDTRSRRATFARSISVAPTTLEAYLSGYRRPGAVVARAIVAATGGQVSLDEALFGIPLQSRG